MARRLVALSSICNTELDPAITKIAQEGLLDRRQFAEYSLTQSQMSTIQTLCDCNFRALVPSSAIQLTARTVLVMAKVFKLFPVFVVTSRSRWWKELAVAIDFPAESLTVSEFKSLAGGMEPRSFKDQRHGLFVADDSFNADQWHKIGHHAFDFPKTIFLTATESFNDMASAVRYLSPKAPVELLTNKNALVKRKLAMMGFNKKAMSPEGYGVLFNIVTDLIVEPTVYDVSFDDEL